MLGLITSVILFLSKREFSMKKQTIVCLVAGCALFGAAQRVLADNSATQLTTAPTQTSAIENPVTLPKPMSSILQNLQIHGYFIVRKIEFENGMYQAEAINGRGKRVKIKISPKTGEVAVPEVTDNHLTALDVAKKLEAAGYTTIYKIKADDKKYNVEALDNSTAEKIELNVDSKTGEISKEDSKD